MKLTNILPQIKTDKVQPAKRNEAAATPGGAAASTQGTDRVNLSAGSQDIQRVQEVLAQTPEVRLEKIQELKDRIERGEYQVDVHAVAERMLQTLLTDQPLN